MVSDIQQRVNNLTVGAALDACYINEMLRDMLPESRDAIDDAPPLQENELNNGLVGLGNLKVIDAAFAYATLQRLRKYFSVPESFTDKDVFNRIFVVISLLTDDRENGLLDKITGWLNETGMDANLSSDEGEIPNNVISIADFLSRNK